MRLGRLELANPILVASGTFGYAREMAGLVDLGRLGGILPKTITAQPRAGNTPWRTVETPSGMLNSIGLDNDGIETFIAHHLPYLAGLGTAIVVSIAAHDLDEFVAMAARLDSATGLAAIELNLSCPNVAGGVDFGTDAAMCRRVVAGVRAVCRWPILAKLTPNVTRRRRDRPGRGRRRRRCHLGHQHLPGHGGRLAAAATALGQRAGRTERAGDQADRAARRLPGRPGG